MDARPDDPEPLDEVVSGAWTGATLLLITCAVFVSGCMIASLFPGHGLLRRFLHDPDQDISWRGALRLGAILALALVSTMWLALRRRDERRRAARLDARERSLPSFARTDAVRLVARPGADCPFCHDALAPGDLGEGVVRCPACEVSHHSVCWREHEGCSTLGCRRDPNRRDEGHATRER